MKHYITVYQNEKQLLGSDFNIIINSDKPYLGATKIRNEFRNMENRIETLKTIKPYLNNGKIEIHYQR
jgi:hypothetical protein